MPRLAILACALAASLVMAPAVAADAAPRARAFAQLETLVAQAAPQGTPTFEGWLRRDELFGVEARGAARARHDGFQTGEAQALIWTYYDPVSVQHLHRHRLNEPTGLRALRRGGATTNAEGDPTIPPLPDGATIVLTVWWPVATDRPTALPVWDPEANPPLKDGNHYLTWKRVVAIDPDPAPPAAATTPVELVGRGWPAANRVGLAAFPHRPVDAALAAEIARDPDARKAAVIALGRTVHAGDQLALVAMHAITKQQGRWSWTTLWWHDQPTRGEFAQNRPASLRGAWRNFLLDTLPGDAPDETRPCFNPWLEARFPDEGFGGGTASNCLACHRRASHPAVRFLPAVRRAQADTSDPALARGQLGTDFLWSVARGARHANAAR